MVGASENSGWATSLVGAAATMGFNGRIVPVHPRAETAFGRPVIRSLRDLDEPVDITFILRRSKGPLNPSLTTWPRPASATA